MVGDASVFGYVCLVEMRSILDAWYLCGKWGMLRGPSAPICSGASCWASVLRVCVVRVVAMRLSVEFFGVGACVQCVVGRVGAFVCVWVVGFLGILCVLRLCGGMPPESLELMGSGVAWLAPFPRFARSCQGA